MPTEEVQAKQASLVIQKIPKAQINVVVAGGFLQDLKQYEVFSIRKMYISMRGVFQKNGMEKACV